MQNHNKNQKYIDFVLNNLSYPRYIYIIFHNYIRGRVIFLIDRGTICLNFCSSISAANVAITRCVARMKYIFGGRGWQGRRFRDSTTVPSRRLCFATRFVLCLRDDEGTPTWTPQIKLFPSPRNDPSKITVIHHRHLLCFERLLPCERIRIWDKPSDVANSRIA